MGASIVPSLEKQPQIILTQFYGGLEIYVRWGGGYHWWHFWESSPYMNKGLTDEDVCIYYLNVSTKLTYFRKKLNFTSLIKWGGPLASNGIQIDWVFSETKNFKVLSRIGLIKWFDVSISKQAAKLHLQIKFWKEPSEVI